MDNTRKTVGQGFDVPIRYKANLTIDEAVEYSGISRAGLLKMTNQYDCPFVLRLGHRRLMHHLLTISGSSLKGTGVSLKCVVNR